MEVGGFCRRDPVIAELDIPIVPCVWVFCLKGKANTAIAFFVSQHFVTGVFIGILVVFTIHEKINLIVCDFDFIYIGFVACFIIVFIFLRCFIFFQLRFIIEYLIQCSLFQQWINRLPITGVIRQWTVFDLRLFEVAIIDSLFLFCSCFRRYFFSRCIRCFLQGRQVFFHDRDIILSRIHLLLRQTF